MDIGCAICQDPFTFSGDCDATKCGHIFHARCLDAWICHSPTCPTCRTTIRIRELTRMYFTTTISDQSVQADELLKSLTSAGEREVKLIEDLAYQRLANEIQKNELVLQKAQLEKTNNKRPYSATANNSSGEPEVTCPVIMAMFTRAAVENGQIFVYYKSLSSGEMRAPIRLKPPATTATPCPSANVIGPSSNKCPRIEATIALPVRQTGTSVTAARLSIAQPGIQSTSQSIVPNPVPQRPTSVLLVDNQGAQIPSGINRDGEQSSQNSRSINHMDSSDPPRAPTIPNILDSIYDSSASSYDSDPYPNSLPPGYYPGRDYSREDSFSWSSEEDSYDSDPW